MSHVLRFSRQSNHCLIRPGQNKTPLLDFTRMASSFIDAKCLLPKLKNNVSSGKLGASTNPKPFPPPHPNFLSPLPVHKQRARNRRASPTLRRCSNSNLAFAARYSSFSSRRKTTHRRFVGFKAFKRGSVEGIWDKFSKICASNPESFAFLSGVYNHTFHILSPFCPQADWNAQSGVGDPCKVLGFQNNQGSPSLLQTLREPKSKTCQSSNDGSGFGGRKKLKRLDFPCQCSHPVSAKHTFHWRGLQTPFSNQHSFSIYMFYSTLGVSGCVRHPHLQGLHKPSRKNRKPFRPAQKALILLSCLSSAPD